MQLLAYNMLLCGKRTRKLVRHGNRRPYGPQSHFEKTSRSTVILTLPEQGSTVRQSLGTPALPVPLEAQAI